MTLIYLATEENAAYQQLLDNLQVKGVQLTRDPAEAEVVLAAPPIVAPRLQEFTALKWLQSTYAGVDALLTPALPGHFLLTNVRGIFGQQIAEYVLGLGLYYSRRLGTYAGQQAKQQWQQHAYESVHGKNLLIVGTGSIGNHLAGAARALGLRPFGINRSGTAPAESAFDSVHPMAQANGLLQQADWVVCALPSTPNTLGVFNASLFANCRQALFFNVGRGSCVVHADLIKALDAGHLAHAFLDVFVQEPLLPGDALWPHPKVTVTPHIAAPSVPEQVVDVFLANLERYQQGIPLKYIVDRESGY